MVLGPEDDDVSLLEVLTEGYVQDSVELGPSFV